MEGGETSSSKEEHKQTNFRSTKNVSKCWLTFGKSNF